MGPEGQTPAAKKEAMQKLREARKQTIKAATARMKEQKKAFEAITDELQKGERTVPEIAAATGIGSASVLWYITALKKYGLVAEGQADGGYFRYGLAANRNNAKG
jgi:predicted transcriptional regulator